MTTTTPINPLRIPSCSSVYTAIALEGGETRTEEEISAGFFLEHCSHTRRFEVTSQITAVGADFSTNCGDDEFLSHSSQDDDDDGDACSRSFGAFE